MATGLGYQGFMGFGTETVYGTPLAATKWSEFNNGGDGLTTDEERLESASVYGVHRELTDMKQGAISVSGDMVTDVRYEGLELLYKMGMGAVTSTQQGTTSAYSHLFKLTDTIGTSLTVEVERDIKVFKYEGCMVNTITWNVTNTGFLIATFGFIGEDTGTGASPTAATLPTAPLACFSQGAFTWNSGTVQISNFSLTHNNNLSTDRRFIGSRLVSQPQRTSKMEVTGSFTTEFENSNEYDDFRNAQERAMRIDFIGGSIASGGTNTYLYSFVLANVRLTGGEPHITDEGVIMLDAPFKAYASGTGTREYELTIRNAVTTV